MIRVVCDLQKQMSTAIHLIVSYLGAEAEDDRERMRMLARKAKEIAVTVEASQQGGVRIDEVDGDISGVVAGRDVEQEG